MASLVLKLSSPLLRKAPRLFAESVKRLTDEIARLNEVALRSDPRIPRLYESGVFYKMKISEGHTFADLYEVIRKGYGHCQHLTGWRVAELRCSGEDPMASAAVKWQQSTNPAARMIFHVLVRRGDGSEEDPSQRLGMGASPWEL